MSDLSAEKKENFPSVTYTLTKTFKALVGELITSESL
jgi:hypothetical protein